MNLFKKIFFSIVIVFALTAPHTAVADACSDLKARFQNAGGTGVIQDLPEYCSPEAVYTKFANFAMFAIGIVAVIAIIYGGYLYMTAAGNEAQTKKGRSVLTWAIVGLIVVLAAAVIVNVVVRALVENRFV
jgi:hypothetical protein